MLRFFLFDTDVSSVSYVLFENELIGLKSEENDKSGMFSIFKDVIVGDKFTKLSMKYDVSLVSFASLDKLYWIPIVLRYI